MPYIYSNHGLSIRWEDEIYVTQDGETASDVFVPPPEPASEQSVEQASEQSAPLPPVPVPSVETRLATVEVRLEQFLKIATGITTAATQH